ncbi:MAG: N-acetyltransferase family protein [Candidatus Hodarchaeales archaeon]|jgi:RimJ/RimL family protein N-acetyltransferase
MNVLIEIRTSKGPIRVVEYERKLTGAVIDMYELFDDRVLDYALPPYTPKKIHHYLSLYGDNGFNFLAINQDDDVVGHLQVHKHTDPRRSHCAEFFVYVHQDYHDLSIGKTLVTKMIEWAREKRVKKIKLACFADNDRAIHVYKRMGFRVEGRLEKEFFRKGEYYDKIHMSLWLDKS